MSLKLKQALTQYKVVWQIDDGSPWTTTPKYKNDEHAISRVKAAYDGSAHITFVSIHSYPTDDTCIYSEGNLKPWWNEEMPTKLDGWERPYPMQWK